MWFKMIVLAIVAVFASSALGQEMILNQLDNFSLPETLISLNVQDLNHDGQKEIIALTDHHIFTYTGHNGTNYQLLWTSPSLSCPKELILLDVDNDSLTDVAVSDSQHIYLFDIYNNNTLWSSPQLDSTYRTFTAGDRNNDGWADIVMIRKELFTRRGDWNNNDTVWIDIYDGPNMQYAVQASVFMRNATRYGNSESITEFPIKAEMASILEGSTNVTKLMLFSKWSYIIDYYPDYRWWAYSGLLRLFDPQNFVCSIDSAGEWRYHFIANQQGQNFIKVVGHARVGFQSRTSGGQTETVLLHSLSADSVIGNTIIWERRNVFDWYSYFAGDMRPDFAGPEILFTFADSIYLYSPDRDSCLWQIRGIDVEFVVSDYNNPVFFNFPQILMRNNFTPRDYRLYSANTGILSATITDSPIIINTTADLDCNGTDEILATNGLDIEIFEVTSITNIEGDGILPRKISALSVYPNPFNGTATIEYYVTDKTPVIVEIFDINGRNVHAVLELDQEVGVHRVQWNATGRSSGPYFCRLMAGDQMYSAKMIYIK